MPPTTGKKKTCLCCANEWAVSAFYSHKNELINESFGICKKCVQTNVDLGNLESFINFLRTMNLPYLKDYWKVANDDQKETIGMYLKNINTLQQNKHLRFKDSDPLTARTNDAELMEINHADFEISEDIVNKWGRNLTKEDYVELEAEFDRFGGNQAENNIQENIYRNMAKTQWMANKALQDGRVNDFDRMMKVLSNQMSDANIKPVQKGQEEDNKARSFGEMIKMIEETEPITENIGEYEPKFVKDYVERFFISQMKRVFGKIKDEDIVKLAGED